MSETLMEFQLKRFETLWFFIKMCFSMWCSNAILLCIMINFDLKKIYVVFDILFLNVAFDISHNSQWDPQKSSKTLFHWSMIVHRLPTTIESCPYLCSKNSQEHPKLLPWMFSRFSKRSQKRSQRMPILRLPKFSTIPPNKSQSSQW